MANGYEVGGVTYRPAFLLLAEKYMDDQYLPENVAERTGVPADRIRKIAAQLAHTAFEEEITIDQPWTDWKGEKHDKMIGPPSRISRHARDFGAFKRLPNLPCTACAANSAGGRLNAPVVSVSNRPTPNPLPPTPNPIWA